MNAEKIRRFLSASENPSNSLGFLSNELLPAIVEKMNQTGTRRRMALYGGDRIPENERNLTDVRNRMSLLIEYKLAWFGNEVLSDYGISDLFWTNVVANRFPDLEVRNDQGHRGLRIEVKCLQAVAEEKSANFDTLKKDVNPNTDFIVVFIWEWFRDQAAIAWDRAPKILRAFIFHASSLAELRDYNWLRKAPTTLGEGFQGFDLRYAVNCRLGSYSQEEGNYGKLLRIWGNDVEYQPSTNNLLEETINTYFEFEDFSVWSGFEVLANFLLSIFEDEEISALTIGDEHVGFKAGDIGIIFKRRVPDAQAQKQLAQSESLTRFFILNDKYQWAEYRNVSTRAEKVADGRKPKHLVRRLSES